MQKRFSGKFVAGIAVASIVFGYGLANSLPNMQDLFSNQSESTNLAADLDYTEVEKVYDILRREYDGELNPDDLLDGAKSGLARATGDPYTVYLDEEETEDFQDSLNGTFSGIGAEIAIKNNQLVVVTPLKGYPAQKAGLRSGDAILAVDDKETFDMTIEQAVSRIRGEEGTTVTLTIKRGRKVFDIDITRDVITIKSVESRITKDNIGIIEISRFSNDTTELINQAADNMKNKKVDAVVLDLRNNPGGLLDTAVEVAGVWLNNQPVVIEKKGDEVLDTLRSGPKGQLNGIETVVLINGGSASASEIVAGALQDYGAATVIGEQSFGKGSVQSLENVTNDSLLKVTVARWFTPDGHTIDGEGITPDIKVKLTEEDFNNDRDPQLDRALKELR